jgi:glycerophosphoryl diester phosphodiesterase
VTLRTRVRRRIGRILHVAHPTPKHVENSVRGIRRAHRRGFASIDLDMQITKDRVIVGTHWARPLLRDGFRDPKRRIGSHAIVRNLTWAQVARLRAGRWPRRYRISRIERLLSECARLGVVALLEPKGDPRFATDWPWQHIAAVAEDVGCTVSVRALGENAAALKPARKVGFEAWEI